MIFYSFLGLMAVAVLVFVLFFRHMMKATDH